MNRLSFHSAAIALGLGVAIAAGVAEGSMAQTAPRTLPANPEQNPGGDPRDDRQFGGQDDPRDRFDQRGPRDPRDFDRDGGFVDRRLDFLHSELRITPAQDGLWRAFAEAVENEARMRQGIAARERDEGASVVERLEDRQRMLDVRSEGLDRILGTLRPLYASLSAGQRRIADREMFQPQNARRFAGRFGDRRFGRERGFGGYGGGGYGGFGMPDFRNDRDRDYR